MSTIYVTLTAEQAAAYDNTDDSVRKPVMDEVFADAQRQANEMGRAIEISHPEGFVVEVIEPADVI